MPIFFPSYLTKKCQNSDFLVYSQVVLLVIFGAKIQMRRFCWFSNNMHWKEKVVWEQLCLTTGWQKSFGILPMHFSNYENGKKICEFFSLSFSDFLALPLSRKKCLPNSTSYNLDFFFHVYDFSLTLGIFTKKVVQSQNWFFFEKPHFSAILP